MDNNIEMTKERSDKIARILINLLADQFGVEVAVKFVGEKDPEDKTA